ncbi:morphogenetic protein [Klebsiella pneumoniae]|uniref:morphogenetic protein n=1 Tax=Klebsiella pneumoniae TaxID=573 RepID=UPI00287C1580|nr:morphogenetic protein [Klebsiella pneumoniae]MDS7079141.1 morphogenetic protein [Klebsiella pneumoniae]MDS7123063.1 morphogenetic protein [Klebsiella pneumoniae]
MKERGMIFNSEMVRAILDGRKTQTRRIMKLQPKPSKSRPGDFWFSSKKLESMVHVSDLAPGNSPIADYHLFIQEHCCPFGAVGDRIWVRETFQGPLFDYDLMDSYCKDPTPFEKPEFCVYKADGVPAPEFYDADDELHCCWRPSIHMPRWASRILLEITDVRVERLNAISEEDATAEGVPPAGSLLPDYPGTFLTPKGDFATAKVAFQRLWESIYGEESWKANSWVWVISFKRVEGGAA